MGQDYLKDTQLDVKMSVMTSCSSKSGYVVMKCTPWLRKVCFLTKCGKKKIKRFHPVGLLGLCEKTNYVV